MDARVTNIQPYLEKKITAHNEEYFSSWSDDRIRSRYPVLKAIQEGNTDLVDMESNIYAMLFPGGFHPDTTPGDNLMAVTLEGIRRGVLSA